MFMKVLIDVLYNGKSVIKNNKPYCIISDKKGYFGKNILFIDLVLYDLESKDEIKLSLFENMGNRRLDVFGLIVVKNRVTNVNKIYFIPLSYMKNGNILIGVGCGKLFARVLFDINKDEFIVNGLYNYGGLVGSNNVKYFGYYYGRVLVSDRNYELLLSILGDIDVLVFGNIYKEFIKLKDNVIKRKLLGLLCFNSYIDELDIFSYDDYSNYCFEFNIKIYNIMNYKNGLELKSMLDKLCKNDIIYDITYNNSYSPTENRLYIIFYCNNRSDFLETININEVSKYYRVGGNWYDY